MNQASQRPEQDHDNTPLALLGYAQTEGGATGLHGCTDSVAATLAEACTRRGWYLAEVVRDPHDAGDGQERPGLEYALARLSAGRADGLVVAELHDLADSLAEMAPVLHWFAASGRALVATDIDLDSTAPGGARLVHLLALVAERERERTVAASHRAAAG